MAEGRLRRRTHPIAVGEPARATSPVVLIVEDDADVRETLRIELSLEGWTVIEAASAEEALERWGSSPPAAVVLDQQLPGMSGLECAATLRERSADTRIIMFSAFLDPTATKEARRLRILPLEKQDHERLRELFRLLAEQIRTSTTTVG